MKTWTKADFTIPALLIALSLVPTLGGIVRLASVSGHAAVGPDDARFMTAPAPVVLHVLSATLFCLLGASQFSRGFRLRWPGVHRSAGKLLALCGVLAGATGLWMTAFYPIPASLQGPILYVVRLLVASSMIGSILVAWWTILHRDVRRHEAFMIRAYALGQGAGTQVLVLGPWQLIAGECVGVTRDILMTLAWLINVVVAELLIQARTRRVSVAVEVAALSRSSDPPTTMSQSGRRLSFSAAMGATQGEALRSAPTSRLLADDSGVVEQRSRADHSLSRGRRVCRH